MISIKNITFVTTLVSLVTSCGFISIKEQQEKAADFCQLTGTIATEQVNKSNLIVALLRQDRLY